MKLEDNAKVLLALAVIGGLLFVVISLSGNKGKLSINLKGINPPAKEKAESVPKAERYFISSKVLPQFTEVLFDPFNVKINGKQTVTIRVKNTEPVKSVYVVLNTDTKMQRYDLKLSDGSPIDGNWQGFWNVSDTRSKIYSFTFYAVSENKSSDIDFSFGKEFPKSVK